MHESPHAYEVVMSHVWIRPVTYVNASHHTYQLSHVTHANELCLTCAHEWAVSNTRMSRSKHMDISCLSTPRVSDECRWKRHLWKRRHSTHKKRRWKKTYYEHQMRSLTETCCTVLYRYFGVCLCVAVCDLTLSHMTWFMNSYTHACVHLSLCDTCIYMPRCAYLYVMCVCVCAIVLSKCVRQRFCVGLLYRLWVFSVWGAYVFECTSTCIQRSIGRACLTPARKSSMELNTQHTNLDSLCLY